MDTVSFPMGDVIAISFEQLLTKKRIINKVHHDLQKKLQKKGQPSTARINYVYHLMTQHNVFPDLTKMKEDKSDAKSEEFRKLGNTYFTSQPPQFLQALASYNKSICYAVSPEKISTAIANRSAVLFNMQMYPECLESIRMAREIGVPEKIEKKLVDREAICHGKMEKMPPNETFIAEIGMPVNERIPFLANCLKLRENKKFGKHVITDEDIPAGTFIAIEKPYCKTVANTDKYLRCATCLLEVPHLLFPCDKCTQTMFCSNECKEEALTDFHTIECPINGALFKLFDPSNLMAFRLCIQGLMAFRDTEAMALGLKKMLKEQKTIFNFNWNQELTPEEVLTPIYTMQPTEHKLDKEQMKTITLLMYVKTCLTFKILKSNPTLCRRYMKTPAADEIVKDFIYRNILNTFTNTTSYAHVFETATSNIPREYGNAMFSFKTLIRHSCSPNVCLFIMGSALGMFAIKNIAAGEKLEHLAGTQADGHFMIKSKSDRQRDILFNLGFVCECSACIGNYPQLTDIPIPRNIPELKTLPDNKEFKCYCHLLVATNKKNSQMARDYIQKYGKSQYPNLYICNAEHEIYLSYAAVYGGISLRLRHDYPYRCPKCNDRV